METLIDRSKDCLADCISYITSIPRGIIPMYTGDTNSPQWAIDITNFLHERGIYVTYIDSPESVIIASPYLEYIVVGESALDPNYLHACVAVPSKEDDKIIWDIIYDPALENLKLPNGIKYIMILSKSFKF